MKTNSDLQALHDALSSLTQIKFDDIPTSSSSGLESYVQTALAHAELLAASLPDPAASSKSSSFQPAPANSASNAASTLCDLNAVPVQRHPEHEKLHEAWGKPLKLSAKDNPLGIACYKMAAHDRHGAWFARRSVHQGIGFEKMRKAMANEFLVSLKVDEGPGSGAIRGIAADQRLETFEVRDRDALNIWQLSSVFPGPVTPREFVACTVSSNRSSPSHKDAGGERAPRQFLNISRPTVHPDAPDRSNLVKGTYESIELIREVLLPSDSTADASSDEQDREANPVEWIMITRSDPGGGIPKFMVERGTPGSIVADVSKWLTWAIKLTPEELAELDDEASEDATISHKPTHDTQVGENDSTEIQESQQNADGGVKIPEEDINGSSRRDSELNGPTSPLDDNDTFTTADDDGHRAGVLSRVAGAVGTASGYLDAYIHGINRETTRFSSSSSSSDDDDEDGSTAFFASANASRRASRQEEETSTSPEDTRRGEQSTESFPAFQDSSQPGTPTEEQIDPNEKGLLKIVAKRKRIDTLLARAREDDEQRQQKAGDKPEKERAKIIEKSERERRKQEARYQDDLAKLDAERMKEQRRIIERQHKESLKSEKSREKRQIAELKHRAEVAETETRLLHRQLEALQRENAQLVVRLRQLEREASPASSSPRVTVGAASRGAGSRPSSKSSATDLSRKRERAVTSPPRSSKGPMDASEHAKSDVNAS